MAMRSSPPEAMTAREALEIATKVGVDFIINTVLNRRLELVDVFSGHLVQAHQKAVALLRRIANVFDLRHEGTELSVRAAIA